MLASFCEAAPPACTVTSTAPTEASLTILDSSSGLTSITIQSQSNVTVNLPPFASGTDSPVTVSAHQNTTSQPGQISLQAINGAGASSMCNASFDAASGVPYWIGRGGSITGRIAVVAPSSGMLEAFARGTDNALWTIARISPDGPWGPWQSLGGYLISDPAAALNANDGVEVYGIGGDNGLWQTMQSSPGGAFSAWQELGGAFTGNPTVASLGGALYVYAAGTDHTLWFNLESAAGGPWAGWISEGGYLIGSPAAAATLNEVDVFALGGDNAVWEFTGSQGWSSLGGSIAGNIVPLVVPFGGKILLFARGTDNTLWSAFLVPGQTWSDFSSEGYYLTSDPAAAWDLSTYVVFGRGWNNELWVLGQEQGLKYFGGDLANTPTAAVNQATPGVPYVPPGITVFAEGTDTTLWTIKEPSFLYWQ